MNLSYIPATLGLFLCLLPCASTRVHAAPASFHYYVAPHGSDANPGTAALPFATILRASRNALPGTTVHVAPGTYSGGFQTVMSGAPSARITYVSTNKWGARLVPPAMSSSKMAWDNRGDYVDIVGFDVDGSASGHGVKWTLGIYIGGSHNVVRDNHVHHIALTAPCNSSGGSGIGIDSYYRGAHNDVIGNTVHDIGPQGCRFVQGIYISTIGSARNNVVYGIGGAAIQMWHDASRVVVSHNTVSASMTGILVGSGDYYHSKGPNDFTRVHNNIVFDNAYGIVELGNTGSNNSYRNNLVYKSSIADWRLRDGMAHSGTIAAAPQFVRYGKRGNPDFRLLPHSPAIGKATAEMATAIDIAGKARPTARIDIGAYQR